MLTGKTIGELTQLTAVDSSTKFLVESGSATYYSNYSDVVDGFATTGSNNFTGNQTVTGSFIVSGVTSDGTLTLQPDYQDNRTVQIYNTDSTDVHIKGNANYSFFGDDTNFVKIDDNADTVTIEAVSGITLNDETIVNGDTNIRGNLKVNAEGLEYLPLNIISGQTQFRGGQIDFMSGGTAVFHSTIAMYRDDVPTSSIQFIPSAAGTPGSNAGSLFIGACNVGISGFGGTKYVEPTIATLMVSGGLYLEPYDGNGSQTGSALPSGQRGSMAVSGSNLFFHNGTEWRAVTLS
jgi:hypothetical protein